MTNIKVFRNLKVVENPILDECGEPIDLQSQWKPGESIHESETQYPGLTEGLSADTVYSFSSDDTYSFSDGGVECPYEDWLMMLEEFKTDIAAGDTTFKELITFIGGYSADQIIIGPVMSAKLYKDFQKHLTEAGDYSKKYNEYEEGDGDFWICMYVAWMNAFEYASDNGAIEY